VTSIDYGQVSASVEGSGRRSTIAQLARSPAAWLFLLLVLVAILAPVVAPYGATEVNTDGALEGPSFRHLFGTDAYGMDVFSRVIHGARVDLVLAIAAATLAALVGVPVGAVAGYFGGVVDQALQRMSEVVQAFPVVLLAMAVLGALGIHLGIVVAVIAVINVPVYFRLVRSVVLPWREAEFIEAARLSGNGNISIIVRHVLPNVVRPVMAQFAVTFAWAIQIIAGLSFLGLAVKVPEAEWGLMVQQGAQYVTTGQWWISFFPGSAIFLAVLVLMRLGSNLQQLGST
jgi:peptide/nickel transport system permease protein